MNRDPADARLDRAFDSLRADRYVCDFERVDRRLTRELEANSARRRSRSLHRWRLVGVIVLLISLGGVAAVAAGWLDRWLGAFSVFRTDGSSRPSELRGIEQGPDGSTSLELRLEGDSADTEVRIHPPSAQDGKRRIEVVLPPTPPKKD